MVSVVPLTSIEAWRLLFPAPSIPFLYKSAQAADAEQMQRAVDKMFLDVAALNEAIFAATGTTDTNLVPSDWNLSGAGDGHTFLFTITFTPAAVFKTAINIAKYGFVSASSAPALDVLLNEKLNAAMSEIITDPQNPIEVVGFWNQAVGAAKGTRLMAGFALAVPNVEQ